MNYEAFPVQSDFRNQLLARLALSEAIKHGQAKLEADDIEIEVEIKDE